MLKHNLRVKEETGTWLLKKLETLLGFLLVFFLPTQLAFHYWGNFSYVFGVRVDYFSITVYLTDILIVGLLTIFLLNNFQRKIQTIVHFLKRKKYLIGLFVTLILFNTIFSVLPWVTLYRWIKVILAVSLFYYFKSTRLELIEKGSGKYLVYSISFFSLIGVTQFLKNSSIGGPFYFLGERLLHVDYPGIALVNFFGELKLRAYSVFPHPNSMAGYLGLSILFLFLTQTRKVNLTSFVGMLTTFSLGGITSFVGSLVTGRFGLKINVTKILGIMFFIVLATMLIGGFDDLSSNIKERVDLLSLSFKVFFDNWLIGSGLGTFSLFSPILQPVHNIFALILSETGILGFGLFTYLVVKSFSKVSKNVLTLLLFVVLTGSVDHYWLTLQQNLFLLPVIFGLVNAKIGNS